VEEKDAQGRLLWRLKAQGRFTADKEAGRASGEQVRWELVTPDHRWLAEARAVQLDYRARRALFTGGVQVKSADAPLAYRTGRLVYQMDTGKLVAAGPVELQIHGLTLVAARAVVDTATRELRAHDFRGHCRF
jgi:lipopolysaccharide assembly outer membrane protein LptD (OstA)